MNKNLREALKGFSNQLPIMEGRDKGEFKTLIGEPVTINDFDFMQDADKEYVVFTIEEDDRRFYFGGQVLTDQLHQLAEQGFKADICKDGLRVLFGEKTSKTKNQKTGRYNTYTTVEYLDADDDKPADKQTGEPADQQDSKPAGKGKSGK